MSSANASHHSGPSHRPEQTSTVLKSFNLFQFCHARVVRDINSRLSILRVHVSGDASDERWISLKIEIRDRGYRVHNDLRAPRTDEPTARYIFITNLPQSLPAQYSHYEVLDLSQAQELFTTGEIQGLSYKIARLPEPPELPLSNDLFYTKRSRNLKLDRAYDMLSRPIPNVAADPIPANPSFPPETSGSENQLEDEQDQENNNEDSSEEDIDELMDLMALNLDGDFGWQQDFNYEAVRVRGSLNNPVVEWVIIVRKDGVLDEEDDLELGVGHHQIRIHSEQPLNTPNPMLGVGSGAGDHSGVFEV